MKLLLLLLTPAMAKDPFGSFEEGMLMYCKDFELPTVDVCTGTGRDVGTYCVR